MAALVLSVAGATAGAVFGPIGAFAGRLVGALAGNVIDHALLGGKSRTLDGPRLSDLDVMASTEGAAIARVYGRARIAGQVIWATQLEEVVSTRTESAGGKGGMGATTTTTTYSYFANFAVGLCDGEIGHVARIWADGKLLDLSTINFRLHHGREDQSPDGLIVAKEGAANAPAYRGLAYIVFERLPLEKFGNRIPQLAFEVIRPIGALERMVRAVTLIPATTEFGYDTATVVRVLGPGQSASENRHVANAPTDALAALDELQALCPNLERVAIVVAWFGSDLRAAHCAIRPGVDNAEKNTYGGVWSVAGETRASAYVVSRVDGQPAFGGTPSDASVKHLIAELKARGLKVTLYPFVMMDIAAGNTLPDPWSGAASQPVYPWRGRITCDPAPGRASSPDGTAAANAQIATFFHGASPTDWSYRRMVLHYAALAVEAGGVDAFLIGSELTALTRVRAGSGVYPAVHELVALAGDVKAVLGSSTLVTYGADWTEYGAHVVDANAQEVRFPLDALWGSSAIDVVGIDYYAPLADWREQAGHADSAVATSTCDAAYLAGNLAGGEAYAWYYADDAARAAQTRAPITDGLGKPWMFRAKDVWNWWAQPHVERVGGVELSSATAWVPQGKPIWFTEVGCPAVDKGANQPSVFPDPKSSESALPYFSLGHRDDLIQRRYLETVIAAFDPVFTATPALNPVSTVYGGRMMDVTGLHLWTWDARPYPIFPAASDVWSDAPNWETGHWLNGRLGGAPLAALVPQILSDCGVAGIDAARLGEGPDGYVVDRPMAPRAMIEPLALAYAFDAVADADVLVFRPRGSAPVAELDEDDAVLQPRRAATRLTRAQETELPREISIGFSNVDEDYRRAAVLSRRLVGGSSRALRSDLAVVTSRNAAARRADIWLQDLWAGRETIDLALGLRHLALMPGDVVGVTVNGRRRLYEIQEIVDTAARHLKARSIDPDVFAVPMPLPQRAAPELPATVGPAEALVLDLPTLDASVPAVLARLAVFAQPWPGAIAVWRSVDASSFARVALIEAPAIIGETLDALPRGPAGRWDRAHRVRVKVAGGALTSLPEARVLDGGNAAALRRADGAWEIVQYATATLVAPDTYELADLLRGQMGSEWAMGDPLPAGASFVRLDAHVVPLVTDLAALDRPVDIRLAGASLAYDDASAIALSVTPAATALRPLAPVHASARRMADGIHLTWIRRTRVDGDSWSIDVPLAEDQEAYAVDILAGATVKRTLAVAAANAIYLAADEMTDFGVAQTSLAVRIYQLSAVVGRGIACEATFAL